MKVVSMGISQHSSTLMYSIPTLSSAAVCSTLLDITVKRGCHVTIAPSQFQPSPSFCHL
ncbi:hypothetical protein HBI81_031180 [Parastagonospora nodorum]|nr:hypothetical protein HBH52_109580 [Parastagonospora nodorum]KAH4105850.1 hypothetical protein HBH46_084820 [Parastagonospora nodorum]KAH4223396.1 hypothetical protein HBI06_131010 [Parastagonospora nodorum]KAH4224293.1 hypothetical protein HBI05_240840 [Parastagonospora nodorum]KAH4909564.1 hypothetical protein HBI80_044880 [Parastagonospora nodorum]